MKKWPLIHPPLPGPKARKLINQDRKYVSPSYTRYYPLVVEKAKGLWVHDVDGNIFLDFTAGIAVCATGHCHPRVIKAIKKQADLLLHMSGTDFYYRPQIVLAKKLAQMAPGKGSKKVYFGNSGAEAVEAAFKLARWHTKRELNLAFYGAFHGRTMGALSLTASKTIQKKHYNPLVPGITHIPYAYCYRCPYNLSYPECELGCVKWVEDTLFRTTIPPEEVATIFVEPIQGEGGYIVPPPEFHREMNRIAKKYGILYVVDEVQSGMGRTGKMFAMEHFGVDPDIIALAKGIASGMPLGALTARAEIMDWEAGSHASTFGGNPVSCMAALTTIELLEEGLMENAAVQGKRLMDGLVKLQQSHECMGDVRGKGLMVAVEFVKNRETKEPARTWRNDIIKQAFNKGLLLLGCGENSIRFCPSLTVNTSEIDKCLSIFDDVVREIAV
ncbi:MAG: acetyl ornithine aminotransferase family protein [Desulfobacteraceae bacterium]|nr:acetyl ornithine aminotransferase family protein [Desulfobacteraceae bacterium]MDH3573734.1 acetyl ornithine aminotransferase family protein [Desulfobacteraceae bacterium]MDH3720916.1 acetyl ornithine aminotransferase family protein [Desulfobacteraceae bacterium]MDH3836987.1 acetyl ornithine aminotransferase family protein [Desulfobacteraceae bacterium]MDH3873381.1 acetyl ornithine aminotransferase family protein [Desulfobacteraceae bacterium]